MQGFFAQQFGSPALGDEPVAADYDGDGKTDLAIYRGRQWFIQRSSNNSLFSVGFGTAGDTPIPRYLVR
jgi:hypothetical protein